MERKDSRFASGTSFFLCIVAVQALVLYLMGQPLICTCGYVKLWEGVVSSSGNSQHLTDWYTFSHVLHGFGLYLLLWLLFPRAPAGLRFALAVGLEAAWEIIENTPMVINHYRKQALAQGYIGDSILNSVSDNLAMVAGFLLSWRLPAWSIVGIALGMEVLVCYCIRDNLALNILNLIHVFPSVAEWQTGR
jgi:hypothetical protein